MADTPKRAGPTALTATAATLYTVPAATTFLLRSIHVCNESNATALFTMSIGTDGAGKRIFKDFAVTANGVALETMLIVLTATEVIQAFSTTGANLLTVILSGIEVS
jgi:hypothetical protein